MVGVVLEECWTLAENVHISNHAINFVRYPPPY